MAATAAPAPAPARTDLRDAADVHKPARMNFWAWLAQVGPGWPSERQWVMVGVFISFWGMLMMAWNTPTLWQQELFKMILQAFVVTGIIGMILPFFYAANKTDETRADNTNQAFRTFRTLAENQSDRPTGENDDPISTVPGRKTT